MWYLYTREGRLGLRQTNTGAHLGDQPFVIFLACILCFIFIHGSPLAAVLPESTDQQDKLFRK